MVNSRSSEIMEESSILRFWTKPSDTMSEFRSGSLMTDKADRILDCQSDGYFELLPFVVVDSESEEDDLSGVSVSDALAAPVWGANDADFALDIDPGTNPEATPTSAAIIVAALMLLLVVYFICSRCTLILSPW